jgi:aminoglycoside phosphotransferase (APT) family kinase protein
VTSSDYWRKAAERGPVGLDRWSARHLEALADLEAGAPAAAVGSTLLHLDLRADNLLITPENRVLVVDWPHARVGASWVDTVFLAPSLAMQGGPPPEELLARDPHGRRGPRRRGRRRCRVLYRGGFATRVSRVAHAADVPVGAG